MELPERLLKTIRKQEFIKPGDRVAAAVSGGADSVALVLLLLELRLDLGIVLSVAHVNHKLRGEESDSDQRFVEDLCRSHDLELHCQSAPLQKNPKSGIEAAARELRYQFFRYLAQDPPGMKIATGHTLDDQAETVLLRILRGTGIRGLSGIHPRIVLKEHGNVGTGDVGIGYVGTGDVGTGDPARPAIEVVRPLLRFRRAELQGFLRERGQTWREDSTNRDPTFLRNRVRHSLLPVMAENFGAALIENLSDLAEIARAEDEHWDLSHAEIRAPDAALDVAALLALPLAVQRRLLRAWIDNQAPGSEVSFRVIEDVLDLAHSAPGKIVEMTGGNKIRRTRESLCFGAHESRPADEYEYSLTIPGEVAIPQLGIRLQAGIAEMKNVPECERTHLLDPDRLPPFLTVRNWRPGDRFWPAHTKEPRKVKELLNDRHITSPEKKLWPVVVAGDELIWMRGFAVPKRCLPRPNASSAIWIRELPVRLPELR